MLKSYLYIAFRNLIRQRFYAFINILSLAIGISICALIFMYALRELSYDQHHHLAKRIYRIPTTIHSSQGQSDPFALGNLMFAPEVKTRYPEIADYCRFLPLPRQTIYHQGETFYESQIMMTDNSCFQLFDFDLTLGNPDNALSQPYSIVISAEKARKYFGSSGRALNQTLQFSRNTYQVRGILAPQPKNSQFRFDMLISLTSIPDSLQALHQQDPMRLSCYNYLLLDKNVSEKQLQQRLEQYSKKVVQPVLDSLEGRNRLDYHTQALQDVHLSQAYTYDYPENNNPLYIYIFVSVGFFVLLIACINYMNLATAKSVRRAKEVGIRKAIGAYRGQLIGQFMVESMLSAVLAFFLALGLIELFLPTFNELADKSLQIQDLLAPKMLLGLLAILVFAGLFAGSYPAFYLSSFQAIEVLKSQIISEMSSRKRWLSPRSLRRWLVVFQFTLSIVLIMGTITVYKQIEYMKNKDLGFRKAAVCVIDIPLGDSLFTNKITQLKQALEALPGVNTATNSSSNLQGSVGRVSHEVSIKGKKITKALNIMFVDEQFISTLGIELKAGSNFNPKRKNERGQSIIINEAAAKAFAWKNPLGQSITNHYSYMYNQANGADDPSAKVIGVVKNFHYRSLQNPIEPLVLMYEKRGLSVLMLSLKPQNLPSTLAQVQSVWEKFTNKHPLTYNFLDEQLAQIYQKEEKLMRLFAYFSLLAILISCLGVFSLASYSTEQRTREIGIRKVLGASSTDITRLITRDFLRLVLFSSLLALPLAYWLIQRWLDDFAYRISFSWLPFLLASTLAFLIVFITVSLLALRAARSNPIEILRHE